MDKKEIVSKYVTFCGKLYDKVSTFFNGPHEQTPESIKKCQVRGTWIVSLFIGFAVIGAFMDDEEEAEDVSEEIVENPGAEGSAPTVDISKLGKPKSFKEIAVDWAKIQILGCDTFDSHMNATDGVAFYHWGQSAKVISVDDDGVIVARENSATGEMIVAYVKTDDSGYVDGNNLKKGVYVRRGTHRYESASGAVRTVPAFEKVTREKDVKIFMAMYEAEKAKIKGQ